ncbi:MAG TPA: DUF4340 domain-containing protein [Vicinamibacterales bacterium]|nr:DUF4340 domain-containing protein [Vicinamibacterales bacterium]
MRGLRSTVALIVVLGGLGAYIYFTRNKPVDTGSPKQEKVFATLQADKIESLKITSEKGEATTLTKSGAGWQITEPAAAKADDGEVSGITTSLGSLEVTRAIDDNPSNLKDYGLAEPRIDVAFKADADKDYRHLLIGDKSPTGGDLFAMRGNEKKVFLIPAMQEQTFNKSPFDLRDKTVIKFDRDKVDGIDVTAAGQTVALTKEGGDWKITKPLQVAADFGSVEGLAGRLQAVQMKSIVKTDPTPADLKTYGLDKPQETATLNLGSARATLALGGKADDNTVYARDTSKPVVVTVESTLADDLKKGADEYRRKDIFEFRAYNANRIELTRNGQTVAFEKLKADPKAAEKDAGDKWRRVSPKPADANKDSMDSLLSHLSNSRATSFVASTANTGLDKPELTVVVKFDDGKKEEHVTFGKSGNDIYASRAGEPGAAKVDPTDFSEALKALDELAK